MRVNDKAGEERLMYDNPYDDNQKYEEFKMKFGIKVSELQYEFQKLSEFNQQRFYKEATVFLQQQGIVITVERLITLISQR